MRTGRPRKPTALHVLQGTHRADRHGDADAPEPVDAGLEPPSWLKDAGAKVWAELAPVMSANGCLTEMDVEAFAHCCKWIAISRKRSDQEGRQAWMLADKLLARFGMTPSDRAKISVTPKNDDPFDAFLGKKAK